MYDEPATLVPTDLKIQVQPLLDQAGKPYPSHNKEQQDLATLNYLCSCFEAKQFHGIVSINRNTFAIYIRDQLRPRIPSNCLISRARITLDEVTKTVSVGVSPGGVAAGTIPPTGAIVLSLHYGNMNRPMISRCHSKTTTLSSRSTSGSGCGCGSQQITVKGNIVDKILKGTYQFGVDGYGKVVVSRQSDLMINRLEKLEANAFANLFTGINDVVKMIERLSFANTAFQSFSISVVQDFVFPGGRTFAFKQTGFLKYRDSVAAITYAEATNK
ncbi:MAG: hypothetical protein Q9174_002930 [Haloplaca sp. 1 TL-2023]